MKKLIITFIFFLSLNFCCFAQYKWVAVYDTSGAWSGKAYINGNVRVLFSDIISAGVLYIGGEFDTMKIDTNGYHSSIHTEEVMPPVQYYDGSQFTDWNYSYDCFPLYNNSYLPNRPSVWSIAKPVYDSSGAGYFRALAGRFNGIYCDASAMSEDGAQNIAFWNGTNADNHYYCPNETYTGMDTVFATSLYVDKKNFHCYSAVKTYVAAKCVFCNGTSITDSTRYIAYYALCEGGTQLYGNNNYNFMQHGTNGPVYAIELLDTNNVYAGGRFDSAGTIKAHNIAKWNGSSWDSLGSGTNGTVKVVLSYNNMLHNYILAGGSFTVAGGDTVNNIAVWDGTSWSALGSGFNGPVYALTIHKNKLYAGGGFTQSGGNPANHVAVWNGSTWSDVGGGRNGDVYALASFKGDLYAGGKFLTGKYDTARYIAKYTDTTGTVNVSINSYDNILGLSIYPNPATNTLTIESSQQATIEITNIQGQVIETLATTGNKTNIDISSLAKGMYFIKVRTEKGVAVKKFIKE